MKTRAFLILLAGIAIALLTLLMDTSNGIALSPSYTLWVLVASQLATLVMYPFVASNQLAGWRLLVATSAIYYIIGNLSLMIEAYIFNVTDASTTIRSLLLGIPFAAVASWIWIRLLSTEPMNPAPRAHRSIGSWIGKIIGANAMYFVFYFTAGLTLQFSYPPLMEYYSDKLPPLMTVIVTNLFIRGFLFVTVAIIIDRFCALSVWHKAVATGLIFAVIGGISPLLAPNELMPQHIRIAHGFEVGISNFLYGLVLSRIIRLREKQPKSEAVMAQTTQSKAVAL